jgi:hypothetical protein
VFSFSAARKMSFRRFVNLASNDSLKCVYTLRHMDTSRLFVPAISNNGSGGGRSTPAKDDCLTLPEPVANFFSSHLLSDAGDMNFMPFGTLFAHPVRLAYQPPASSTFLSQQTSHQQPASRIFLSEQTRTSHQPPVK